MKREYQTSQGLPNDKVEQTLKELTLGYLNLSDGFFTQAEMNFQLALQFDKKCPDAYWGLMLVKLQLQNEDELFSNPVKNKTATELAECQKALECASEELKKVYDSLLERINKINEGNTY